MLKRRGISVDPATQGVILHGGSDPEDCDCESCSFARRIARTPGVTRHEVDDGIVAYVMPVELALKLSQERSGITVQ